MPRDPRPTAITRAKTARVVVDKATAALEGARRTYRLRVLEAVEAGLSRGEMARQLGVSEGLVRQYVARAELERAERAGRTG